MLLKPQGGNYLSDSYGSGRRALVEMQDDVDLSKWYTEPEKQTKISVHVQSLEKAFKTFLSTHGLRRSYIVKRIIQVIPTRIKFFKITGQFLDFLLRVLVSGLNKQPSEVSLKTLVLLLNFIYSNGLKDACVIKIFNQENALS